jgi:hypothetical protein
MRRVVRLDPGWHGDAISVTEQVMLLYALISSLSVHDVSIDVSTVEIPVGVKGKNLSGTSNGHLDFG